ncbi:hypothetical protein HELRODRAFT_107560 [Helobdella robusta]|uniref:receptor protein serine/threonine kinase n=1 Tax=Helobdella robusta TaxID=6412 RepID=T1EEB2_HELRO|nr:hypothetical protein HELRODRAFT_107560 [Helobdella robusta]ESN96502.1 hypothetical protein HELRODRAFT_107560 [Helobdella robusta]
MFLTNQTNFSSIVPSLLVDNQPMVTSFKCACDHAQRRCPSDSLDYCTTSHSCFSAVRKNLKSGRTVETYGCLKNEEQYKMNCHMGSKRYISILCCKVGDFCNKLLQPKLTAKKGGTVRNGTKNGYGLDEDGTSVEPHLHEALYVLIFFMFLTLLGIFIFWFYLRLKRKSPTWKSQKPLLLSGGFSEITSNSSNLSNTEYNYFNLTINNHERLSSDSKGSCFDGSLLCGANLNRHFKDIYRIGGDNNTPSDRFFSASNGSSSGSNIIKSNASNHSISYEKYYTVSDNNNNNNNNNSNFISNNKCVNNNCYNNIKTLKSCKNLFKNGFIQTIRLARKSQKNNTNNCSSQHQSHNHNNNISSCHSNHSIHKNKTNNNISSSNTTAANNCPANCYGLRIVQMGDSTMKGLIDQTSTSGSGSGAPLLAQRTVSRSIQLVEVIAKGKYGYVWHGLYQEEPVAVKIFSSHAENAWQRECNIYNTTLLRHENVLAFLGADTVSRVQSCTQLWLITRYHELGSLYDYLNKNQLSRQQLLRLLTSAASGLVHLHTNIVGTHGKPGIAHRDVKSKNILVMDDGSCCIADLGLAVVETMFDDSNCGNNSTSQQNSKQQHQQPHQHRHRNMLGVDDYNIKVGTRRYMSPEVLDGSIDCERFDSFKKSDVYSFALVMWETARRCCVDDKCEDYELPYNNMVPSDPTLDEMLFVVCTSGFRPAIPKRWKTDTILKAISSLIGECWSYKPDGRLSMLRIKKSLIKLNQHLDDEAATAALLAGKTNPTAKNVVAVNQNNPQTVEPILNC